MANTAIIDLAKPAGTDHALISVINSNMDKIDAEAGRQRGNFAGTYSTTSGYAVGDYCIYQGNLYRCTTAIGSSGENWTAGHWTSVKVGTELKGLSDQIAKQTISTGITGLKAYKAAGIVNLVFEEVSASSASAGWVTIGTLPNSLKPLGRNYFQCQSTDISAFANNNVCNCYVDTNGEVKAYAFSDKLTMYLRGLVTYVCA